MSQHFVRYATIEIVVTVTVAVIVDWLVHSTVNASSAVQNWTYWLLLLAAFFTVIPSTTRAIYFMGRGPKR